MYKWFKSKQKTITNPFAFLVFFKEKKAFFLCLLLHFLVGCEPHLEKPLKVSGGGAIQYSSKLKIAAFNTKTFGAKKVKNKKVLDYFVRLVRKYDIILFQEIRNKSLSAVYQLFDRLNSRYDEYDFRITEPLGRSSYKEQYAYFYKKRLFEKVKVTDAVVYPDSQDDFEREPFLLYLKLKKEY